MNFIFLLRARSDGSLLGTRTVMLDDLLLHSCPRRSGWRKAAVATRTPSPPFRLDACDRVELVRRWEAESVPE